MTKSFYYKHMQVHVAITRYYTYNNTSLVHTSSRKVSQVSWNSFLALLTQGYFLSLLFWQSTVGEDQLLVFQFSLSCLYILFSWLGMLHLLVLNAVVKMLSHTCHNKKLLFGTLFIADSQLYCNQATAATICLLLHTGIFQCVNRLYSPITVVLPSFILLLSS